MMQCRPSVASAYALAKVKIHLRKDYLIERDPEMSSFIADELSRTDAANAKRIRPTDY
jgi:hypothetical protein